MLIAGFLYEAWRTYRALTRQEEKWGAAIYKKSTSPFLYWFVFILDFFVMLYCGGTLLFCLLKTFHVV